MTTVKCKDCTMTFPKDEIIIKWGQLDKNLCPYCRSEYLEEIAGPFIEMDKTVNKMFEAIANLKKPTK